MASSAQARSRVIWSIQRLAVGGRYLDVARLRIKLHLRAIITGQQTVSEWCWLDTGAPFSIIPLAMHSGRLAWQPLAGMQTRWAGQACDLGVIDVWLPAGTRKGAAGPFPMLAKFARSDPPGGPLPILLGLEFLLTHQAHLNLRPPPTGGVIRIP